MLPRIRRGGVRTAGPATPAESSPPVDDAVRLQVERFPVSGGSWLAYYLSVSLLGLVVAVGAAVDAPVPGADRPGLFLVAVFALLSVSGLYRYGTRLEVLLRE